MKRFIRGALLVASCTLAACASGPRTIRLEPPSLQVESLRIENDMVHFRLLVHNRNDHDLYLEAAGVAMRLDGETLFDAAWQLDLDIGPRGRELVSLDAPAMPIAREILMALGNAPDANVGFELSSSIVIDGQRDAMIDQAGFLHPVPGQPGHFR